MQKQRVSPETFRIMTFQLTLIFMLSGCHMTTCPGYPDEYMNWIPYVSGSEILFTDGADIIILHVGETFRSEPYKTSSWITEPFCHSDASAQISGNSDLPEIMIHSIALYDQAEEADYTYTIRGDDVRDADNNILYSGSADFGFQVREGKIMVNFYKPVDLLDSFDNGYKEYDNVLKLESDTAQNYYKPWVYQVCIAEGTGIIQFTELKNKKVWSLLEE